MVDISKLVQGKNLTQNEVTILQYIIDHIEDVLNMGVRQVARDNFTSTSTIMRLAKKMGYSGFVDMHYRLLPLIKNIEKNEQIENKIFENFSSDLVLKYSSYKDIQEFTKILSQMQSKYVFIYGTGFSAIMAEYMYKKFLVLGKKCIFANAADSNGVFESNLEDIGLFVVFSRSGETKLVLDKIKTAQINNIITVTITGQGDNSANNLAEISFQIEDPNKLDVKNISANTFFPNVIMLIEMIVYEYHRLTEK